MNKVHDFKLISVLVVCLQKVKTQSAYRDDFRRDFQMHYYNMNTNRLKENLNCNMYISYLKTYMI